MKHKRKIRILLICRLMNGFIESLRRGMWEPSGSPAIAHMITALADDPGVELTLVFTRPFLSKSDDQALEDVFNRSHKIDGLSVPVLVVAKGCSRFSRLAYYLREFHHFILLRRQARSHHLVYIDRGNILLAALLSRFTKARVVMRLLGVPPSLMGLNSDPRAGAKLARWAWQSPFSHVICTRDGSPGTSWMKSALRSDVPRSVFLNGVDLRLEKQTWEPKGLKDPVSVLFIGRLEAIKGIDFFIDALLEISVADRYKIRPIIVGEGALRNEMEKRVNDAGAKDWVRFLGAVPSEKVGDIFHEAQVYVSLNRQGHLSNTTLEAIAAGCAIVMQEIYDNREDAELRMLLPKHATIALPKRGTSKQLAVILLELVSNPEMIKRLRAHSLATRAAQLESWSVRIDRERQLLTDIIMGSA